jgi:hypothetical protein
VESEAKWVRMSLWPGDLLDRNTVGPDPGREKMMRFTRVSCCRGSAQSQLGDLGPSGIEDVWPLASRPYIQELPGPAVDACSVAVGKESFWRSTLSKSSPLGCPHSIVAQQPSTTGQGKRLGRTWCQVWDYGQQDLRLRATPWWSSPRISATRPASA